MRKVKSESETKDYIVRIKNKDTEIIHTTEKITVSAPKIFILGAATPVQKG